MKTGKLLAGTALCLAAVGSVPVATADWASFKELFKEKSSEAMDSGAVSRAAQSAGLSQAFGWTDADFRDMNLVAAGAAFCDEPTRAAIVARLTEEAR